MKLAVTMFVSMDGIQQGPGGPGEDDSNGFDLGGWLVPYADQDMGETMCEWFTDADAFLLGRKTYEIMAAHWPLITDPNDPVGAALNTLPKYVPSGTVRELDWHNSHLIDGDLVAAVTELKAQPGRTLQVHGSGRLVQSLLRAGLVDELRLITFPVVLGKGQRLFETGAIPAAWQLTEVRATGAGAIVQTYENAGAPAIGTIVVDAEGKEQLLPVG